MLIRIIKMAMEQFGNVEPAVFDVKKKNKKRKKKYSLPLLYSSVSKE